ncbi:MAG TPA: hypothetical protein VF705_09210 [Longimicrobium sp.]|jgi:hypothetical protein
MTHRRHPARSLSARRLFHVLSLSIALVPLFGRAGAAQQNDRARFRLDVSEYADTIPQDPGEVWKALRVVYTGLGFPVSGVADTARHVYLTPFMDLHGDLFYRPPIDYFVCQQYAYGAGDLNNSAVFSFAIRAEVADNHDGRTILRTQTDVRAKRRSWNASSMECGSNGLFERRLNYMVRQQLPRSTAAAPPSAPTSPRRRD